MRLVCHALPRVSLFLLSYCVIIHVSNAASSSGSRTLTGSRSLTAAVSQPSTPSVSVTDSVSPTISESTSWTMTTAPTPSETPTVSAPNSRSPTPTPTITLSLPIYNLLGLPTGSNPNGINGAASIGLGLGLTAAVAAVAGAVFLCVRQRKQWVPRKRTQKIPPSTEKVGVLIEPAALQEEEGTGEESVVGAPSPPPDSVKSTSPAIPPPVVSGTDANPVGVTAVAASGAPPGASAPVHAPTVPPSPSLHPSVVHLTSIPAASVAKPLVGATELSKNPSSQLEGGARKAGPSPQPLVGESKAEPAGYRKWTAADATSPLSGASFGVSPFTSIEAAAPTAMVAPKVPAGAEGTVGYSVTLAHVPTPLAERMDASVMQPVKEKSPAVDSTAATVKGGTSPPTLGGSPIGPPPSSDVDGKRRDSVPINQQPLRLEPSALPTTAVNTLPITAVKPGEGVDIARVPPPALVTLAPPEAAAPAVREERKHRHKSRHRHGDGGDAEARHKHESSRRHRRHSRHRGSPSRHSSSSSSVSLSNVEERVRKHHSRSHSRAKRKTREVKAKALASDEEQEQLVAEVQAEIEAAKRASKKERIRQLLLAQELAAAANLEPPVIPGPVLRRWSPRPASPSSRRQSVQAGGRRSPSPRVLPVIGALLGEEDHVSSRQRALVVSCPGGSLCAQAVRYGNCPHGVGGLNVPRSLSPRLRVVSPTAHVDYFVPTAREEAYEEAEEEEDLWPASWEPVRAYPSASQPPFGYGGFPGYPVAPEPSRAPEGPGFGNPVMAEYMAQQRRREAGGPPRSQHAWYM